jgi:hypothetical protein
MRLLAIIGGAQFLIYLIKPKPSYRPSWPQQRSHTFFLIRFSLATLINNGSSFSGQRIRTLFGQSRMNSDAVVSEVFTTGHGLSRTRTTGIMRVSYNLDTREVALPLGERTSSELLGWFLRRLFLFLRPR